MRTVSRITCLAIVMLLSMGSQIAPSDAAGAFSVTAALKTATVVDYHPVEITGQVSPASPGAKITLQIREYGKWSDSAKARLSANSTYRLLTGFDVGKTTFRVMKPADSQHGRGISAPVTVTVLPYPKATPWKTLTAGPTHTCGIGGAARLWCWGTNYDGELGDTGASGVPLARAVDDGPWASVTLGYRFSCGLKTDHSVWCWGGNRQGQLADGTTTDHAVPAQVGTDRDWTTVAAGHNHACGIKQGQMWCWGQFGYDMNPDGSFLSHVTPVRIGTESDWTAVAAASYASCGLRSDGTAWCWGGKNDPPAEVGDRDGWAQLSVGGSLGQLAVCVLGEDQSLWCRHADDKPLSNVGGDATWTTVASNDDHACAIRSDGTLWCWGANARGQLGIGSRDKTPTPAEVGTAADWTSVTVGDNDTCGVRSDGSAWCWGDAADGKLGWSDYDDKEYAVAPGQVRALRSR